MDQFMFNKAPQKKSELLSLTDEAVVYWANSDLSIAKHAVNVVFLRYSNLIRTIIYSQRDLRYTDEDKKDIRSIVYKYFMIRLRKYNPKKKVPFAGYIKRMLTQDIMNEYGGKKNAAGNIGLKASFCRKWSNEINFTDYINKIYHDENYELDDLDLVMMNANGDFVKKVDHEYKRVEFENDLNKFWVEVKKILSKKKFLVLYYYYKEGLNEREIGDLLKIKQNTVSGHKIDAENKLKRSRLLKSKFNMKDFLN